MTSKWITDMQYKINTVQKTYSHFKAYNMFCKVKQTIL